jgi:hypothetical protein
MFVESKRRAVPENIKVIAVLAFIVTVSGIRLFNTSILKCQPIRTVIPPKMVRMLITNETRARRCMVFMFLAYIFNMLYLTTRYNISIGIVQVSKDVATNPLLF